MSQVWSFFSTWMYYSWWKGGYTGNDRLIIYMVVSYNESKKAIKVMREVDPNCFVTVINTYQVYGKFYIRPI